MSSESENAHKSPEAAVVSKSSDHIYHWSKTPISHTQALSIETIHEATLQDLLHAHNGAVSHLLWERNQLLHKQVELGTKELPYCKEDFLTPPLPPRPYRITAWGHILRYHSDRPNQRPTTYPKDRRLFDKSVQTECDSNDADTTLADVDPVMLTKCKDIDQQLEEDDQDSRNKKRKIN
ncbi:hypothetical protein H4582DRAFT_2074954 [Lactarius indigo]|nr:hypothetical protein H4582DRAFT_2074954 [Lactarius indigo]